MNRSIPPRHRLRSERHNENSRATSRTARRRAAQRAARQLHFIEGPGQADRDQPQRDDQAGGAGAAAARRRAADPAEPAGLPAEEAAVMKRLLAAVLLTLAPAAMAQAPAVDAARAAGAIGERYDGYVGVAAAVSPAVRTQVATINIRRRALYSRLAASKGVSPQDVGITA